jgi:hypothetical protein
MNASITYSRPQTESPIGPAVLPRRVFLGQAVGGTLAGTWLGSRSRAAESAAGPSLQATRAGTLYYIERMRVDGKPYGRYRYAAGCHQPTSYSSTYAAMTRHLYRDLDSRNRSCPEFLETATRNPQWDCCW